ncbi:MAG TPA: 50S ribosomal protein L11 methyltransferase, partial [Draconibacterium sp.]|nr:50S ribosomal protein L11 methyltransferase [Draconibacterium sp.]
ARLGEIEFESFTETENGLEAFIPEQGFSEENLNLVLNDYRTGFYFSVSQEIIKDQNWNQVWEENYFKPLVVAKQCVVRAPFHTDFPKAKYEIIIEPNMAFGTGNHETTSMMLEYILNEDLKGKTVLDMGCGTGILSILASLKNAQKITAIDIDEWSFISTQENAKLNNVKNIEVKHGDASLLGEETYDFIFANIHKNVLIADLPEYTKFLNKDGKIFLSGFYREDIQDIKAQAEKCGLTDFGFTERNNWVAHAFIKK